MPFVPPSTTRAVVPAVDAPVFSYITFVPSLGALVALVDGTDDKVVFLRMSLKPLIIPSEKSTDFTVASSRADAAVVPFAPLVIPVKVVAVVPVYDICSDPINKVPDDGNPAVVSTVITPAPVAGLFADAIAPLSKVSGCLRSLFKYACLLSSFKTILLLPKCSVCPENIPVPPSK